MYNIRRESVEIEKKEISKRETVKAKRNSTEQMPLRPKSNVESIKGKSFLFLISDLLKLNFHLIWNHLGKRIRELEKKEISKYVNTRSVRQCSSLATVLIANLIYSEIMLRVKPCFYNGFS